MWGRDEVGCEIVKTMESYIHKCAETTKSKGFDVTNLPAQTLLIATEVGEALEPFIQIEDINLQRFVCDMITLYARIENSRKATPWMNDYLWRNSAAQAEWLEELADIVIRVFSVIGGNGLTPQFMSAMDAKMAKNQLRPYLHGKQN